MFTGIVEARGLVSSVIKTDDATSLVVGDCVDVLVDTKMGDSVNVNGVCLTVTRISDEDKTATFDLTPETLRRTALGMLKVGDPVNLERSLTPGSRFGGHFVQGHVDTTAVIASIRQEPPNSVVFTFHLPQTSTEQLPDAFMYIVPKGFITLDGTSLTIMSADPSKKELSVMLVPYTLEHINLGKLVVGDKVNVEVDVVGKYVERVVRSLHASSQAGAGGLPELSVPLSPTPQDLAAARQSAMTSLPSGVQERFSKDSDVLKTLEGVVERVVKSNFEEKIALSSKGPIAAAGKYEFDSIEEALKDFAEGKFLVVVDDEDRENEGDLIIAAQHMTTEKMAFLIRYSSGLVCAPMTQERLEELELPLMVSKNDNKEYMGTAFTITVDLLEGTTTGISASDRAKTVVGLADPTRKAEHFAKPGHILPLRAQRGGVLKRTGHTEAAVDLCKLSGVTPVGVICEIVKDDGSGEMARRDDLILFCRQFGIKMITIADMVKYRLNHPMEGW